MRFLRRAKEYEDARKAKTETLEKLQEQAKAYDKSLAEILASVLPKRNDNDVPE